MPSDTFAGDFRKENIQSLQKFHVDIFLCGKGVPPKGSAKSGPKNRDIRSQLMKKLEFELKGCTVRLGEHKKLIRAFKDAVGGGVDNLAEFELSLAKRKQIDLVVIFPSSPGSFAEIGMFSLVEGIARKMAIFIDRRHRAGQGYVNEGPVKAAKDRRSVVFYVDYKRLDLIWIKVRKLVLAIKKRKRTRALLADM